MTAVDSASLPVVGVVGLGLIGGSLARGIVDRGGEVVAATRSSAARAGASGAGVTVVKDPAAVVAAADVVVLAVPLSVLEATLDEVAAAVRALPPGRPPPTVTDVGSVKVPIARSAAAAALRGAFIPGHPMAGTEQAGWRAADPDLFAGGRWALAVDMPVALDHWATVARMAVSVGAAVVPVDSAEHDDAVALVSHLPYLVAALSAGLLPADGGSSLAATLAAGSFADLTRVAGGHPTLGAEMATANAAPLAARATSLADRLSAAAELLVQAGAAGGGVEAGSAQARLGSLFDAGRLGRQAFDAARTGSAPSPQSLDRDGLLALGRRGGRVVHVGDAGPGSNVLMVHAVEPPEPDDRLDTSALADTSASAAVEGGGGAGSTDTGAGR